MSKKKNATWNIPAPRVLDETLEMAIELDGCASKSEFIRSLVRKELERLGFKIGEKQEAPKISC
jgi:metal-responsive CopG/Arc/MetJ family transcriptional regulator